MGKLFKNKSKQTSTNAEYAPANARFGPVADGGAASFLDMGKLLGGDATGFNKYKEAVGFDATKDEGLREIVGSQASSRMLQSGAAAKDLQKYGNLIQNSFAKDYMGGLNNQASTGLGAESLLGQLATKKNKTSTKPALGPQLLKIAASVASGGG